MSRSCRDLNSESQKRHVQRVIHSMRTTNATPVSYDVTKDGVKVAILTFTKSAYRLGETVLGIVEINEREGRGKVISVSSLFLAGLDRVVLFSISSAVLAYHSRFF